MGSERGPVYGLWPSSARTCTLPPGGVSGPVFYAGTGEFDRYDGRIVDAAVVLLDFNCGTEWVNAFLMNAAAVVFVEPASTLSGEAQSKVVDLPLNVPRFWLNAADGEKILGVFRCPQRG